LMDSAMEQFYALGTFTSQATVNIADPKSVMQMITEVENAKKSKESNELVGIPSGFTALDRITGGFRETDLIIIAARPGMGKTAFIASMMKSQGVDFKHPVGMFSLEMAWSQIGIRMLSMMSEVSVSHLRNGTIGDFEFKQLMSKTTYMQDKHIYVNDSAALTITQIRTEAIKMKQRYGIKILYVDYMQLASGSQDKGAKSQNREQEIAAISRGLKGLAKDLKIPVIALSQLSRAVETRGGDKRPVLSDLRESGSIEQDADMVMFLYRPEYYGFTQDEAGNSVAGLGEVIIAKNRHGALDDVNLRFIGKYTKWDEQEPVMATDSYGSTFPKTGNADWTITVPAKPSLDTRTPYKDE
jgi:replicative DNA helicase